MKTRRYFPLAYAKKISCNGSNKKRRLNKALTIHIVVGKCK